LFKTETVSEDTDQGEKDIQVVYVQKGERRSVRTPIKEEIGIDHFVP